MHRPVESSRAESGSGKRASERSAATPMEVVCTGQALSVVRSWFRDDNLGDEELQQERGADVDLKPRPSRCRPLLIVLDLLQTFAINYEAFKIN